MSWSPTFRTLRVLSLCALAVSLPAGPTVGAGGSPLERSTIAFRTGQTGQRQLPAEPGARRNSTEPGTAALNYDGNASPRVAQQVRIAESMTAAAPVVLDATPQVVVGRMVPSADAMPSNSPDRGKTDELFGIATERNQARSVGVVFGASSAERSHRDSRNVSRATTGRELVYTSTGPAVRVDARGPREVNVGVPARYTLTLHNQSATDARGVFVRVTLGKTVEVVSVDASAGEIQRSDNSPDERHLVWMFDMQFTPTAGDAVELHVEWTFLPLGESMQIVTLRPELRLTVKGPEQAVLGEKPLYTVSVENRGNTAADDVVVELSTTGGKVKSVPLGSIPAGDTMQFQIELARLSAGLTELSAVAAAAHGLREETSLAIDVRHVALVATAGGPTSRLAGTDATYQLEVRNTGSAPARNVIASVLLPQGIAPVTIPPSAYKLGDRIAWQVGDLEPDAARGYVFECELVEPGEYTVDFRVADAGQNRVEANLRTTVEATADVRMSVALDDAKIPVGQLFTYTIELENRGTLAAELVDVPRRLHAHRQSPAGRAPATYASSTRQRNGPAVVSCRRNDTRRPGAAGPGRFDPFLCRWPAAGQYRHACRIEPCQGRGGRGIGIRNPPRQPERTSGRRRAGGDALCPRRGTCFDCRWRRENHGRDGDVRTARATRTGCSAGGFGHRHRTPTGQSHVSGRSDHGGRCATSVRRDDRLFPAPRTGRCEHRGRAAARYDDPVAKQS
jgi:uncharacterized repeat protein (TIGR01451 family)